MTEHRIELAPALPPETTTARCSCGDWVRTYTTDDQWSDTLDAAQRHIAGLCGDYQRDDDNHNYNITIHGRTQLRS
jgi:hypothetical protein